MNVSFHNLDLNLLRVFDAVMEKRSVLKASQAIHLSQSAVSHSLARLRRIVNDELFIPTITGMQPTECAIAIASIVREALRSLELAFELPQCKPISFNRTFNIAACDFITMVAVPQLLCLLKTEAPHIDIVIRPSTCVNLAEQIDRGRVDMAIGTFADATERFRTNTLFQYDDVLIADSSQTLGTLTTDRLASLPIAVVSPEGEKEIDADGFIAERGFARRSATYDRVSFKQALSRTNLLPRIAVLLPHFLALPLLLQGSDLAAIVPRPLARVFQQTNPISVYELPYPTSCFNVRSLWHKRNDGDPSHAWLRGMVARATGNLRALDENPTPIATEISSAFALRRNSSSDAETKKARMLLRNAHNGGGNGVISSASG